MAGAASTCGWPPPPGDPTVNSMNDTDLTHRLTWLVVVVLALCASALLFGGCSQLEPFLQGLDKPSASIAGVSLQDLDMQQVTLNFDVDVSNPYTVALPLANLSYGLTSGGRAVLSGDVAPTESVPAKGSSRLRVPATLVFADLLAMVSGIRPGSVVPYEFDGKLDVDTPLGPLALPLRKQGELPVPAVPELSLESVQWGRISMDEATATLNLRVGNTNDFALDLSSMAYDLALGGHSIVSTNLVKPASFGADESALIAVPISFKPKDLGFAVFKLLTGDGAGYALKGDMQVDTPFGPLTLPFDAAGQTTFFN